jgi:hypothetical protein
MWEVMALTASSSFDPFKIPARVTRKYNSFSGFPGRRQLPTDFELNICIYPLGAERSFKFKINNSSGAASCSFWAFSRHELKKK